MSDDSGLKPGGEQDVVSDVHPSGASLAETSSTRRTALGVTAAATAAILADRAIFAPGSARAEPEIVESVNGRHGHVVDIAEVNTEGKLLESELPTSVVTDSRVGAGALTPTASRTSTIAAPTLRDFVSVADYGPVAGSLKYPLLAGGEAELGDGKGTNLEAVYSTLAAAQVKYPAATSLTQTVDWAAVQTAGNAALQSGSASSSKETGQLIWPMPSSHWALNSEIEWKPSSGESFDLDIDCRAGPYSIQWIGANNASVIHTYGLRRCKWSGVVIRLSSASPTGIVTFDIDGNEGAKFIGPLKMEGCEVLTGEVCKECVGFRIAHNVGNHMTGAAGLDFADCEVKYTKGSTGCLGWTNEQSNSLPNNWYSCAAAYCAVGWTNKSTAGAGDVQGGDCMRFYECEGHENVIDHEVRAGGSYGWFGGRYEEGSQLLYGPGGGSEASFNVTMVDVKCEGYKTTTEESFILVEWAMQLTLIGCRFDKFANNPIGAKMIKLKTRGKGSLYMCQCCIENTEPFYTNVEGFTVELIKTSKFGAEGKVTEYFADKSPVAEVAAAAAANPLKPANAKFETYPRTYGGAAQGVLSSGRIQLNAIWMPTGTVIEHISWAIASTATKAPTHWWYALLNSERKMLAVTADQEKAAIAAEEVTRLAIAKTAAGEATSFTTTYTGLYYLAIMVAAETVPTLVGMGFGASLLPSLEPATNLTSNTGQTTPPAFPFTANAGSFSSAFLYASVG
jgi:hypothetical protein